MATFAYVAAVASFVFYVPDMVGSRDSVLVPLAMTVAAFAVLLAAGGTAGGV